MLKITEGLKDTIDAYELRSASHSYDAEMDEAITKLADKARQLKANCARLLFDQMQSDDVITEVVRPDPIPIDTQRAIAGKPRREVFQKWKPTRRATILLGNEKDFVVEKFATPISIPDEPGAPSPKLQIYRYRQNVANDYHEQPGQHIEIIPSFRSAVYVAEVSLLRNGVRASERIAIKESYSKNIAGDLFKNPMQVDDRTIHYSPDMLFEGLYSSGFDDNPEAMDEVFTRLDVYSELLAAATDAQVPTQT